MNFTHLVEQTLEGPPDRVVLFHGTSSGRISEFMHKGILAPRGTVLDYMVGVGLNYLNSVGYQGSEIPYPVFGKYERYIEGCRLRDSRIEPEEDACVYMTPFAPVARDYASAFKKFGSEAYSKAIRAANTWANDNLPNAGGILPVQYEDGKPLVVAVVFKLEELGSVVAGWEQAFPEYLEQLRAGKLWKVDVYQTWFFMKNTPPQRRGSRVYRHP